MARGVDGREIFVDDHDRRNFLRIIGRVKSESGCSILAYCLMGNHFHLAIKVAGTSLSSFMHRLLTTYVLGFNERHAREGHLFQARYKSFLCQNTAYMVSLVRYIHGNPVRARLVDRPEDWAWSSHREYSGAAAPPLADLSCLGPLLGYAEDPAFEPWPRLEARPLLLRREAPPPATLEGIASALFPGSTGALRSGSRRRSVVKMKALVAGKAAEAGHSLVSIAAWMNCAPSAVHRLLGRNK